MLYSSTAASAYWNGFSIGEGDDPFVTGKGRCLARPAWQRTPTLYAERLGAPVDDIR